MVLAAFRFVVWFAATPGVPSALLCVSLCLRNPDVPLVSPAQIVFGVVALVGGFVSPRGFYLWGIAPSLHAPFAEGLLVHVMEGEGLGPVGRTRGLVAFAGITAVLISFAALLYTMLSAAGMGLRYLARGVVPR